MRPIIAHLSAVHSRYDIRIFIKECRSLSFDYHVSYIVADGKGNEINRNISIHDVGKPKNRKQRLLKTISLMLKKAREISADLYHLHDPELLLLSTRLRYKKGGKVIFDAHEDFPEQIYSKPYLNSVQKETISWLAKNFERYICCRLDGIVAATPAICEKYLNINRNSVDVKNYPILNELYSNDNQWWNKKRQVCYAGGLSKVRGIDEIIEGSIRSGCNLKLAGRFVSQNYENKVKNNLCEKVELLGCLDREDVKNLYKESMAGLVTLYPISNYVTSLPIKMFEYMSAGIPVIASNFPLWKEIIEKNQCGLCVNPESSVEIASAIKFIVDNPQRAEQMGQNGRRVVEQKYNWENESRRLLHFYEKILHNSHD
jgi:glycosyltransferase involved in cell wall biosynthesis